VSDITDQPKPPATSRRTAWIIVIITSILFVLALLGVIWGFVRQSQRMTARPAAVSAAPAADAAAVLTLAPGSRIVSASTDAGKLVLHVATPTGGEVEIIDLQTGRRTAQIRTQ